MSKLRKFLLKKLAAKKYVIFFTTVDALHKDEQYGRVYFEMPDGLRLIFEDGEAVQPFMVSPSGVCEQYVGFSTQEPYVG